MLAGFFRGLIFPKILDSQEKQYFHWSINCILFILLYTIFITYRAAKLKMEEELEMVVPLYS
jgi:hypothetical protein